MNEAIERINEIEDGDHVTVTVPVGGQNIQVSGTATVDSNGVVSIQLDEPYTIDAGIKVTVRSVDIPRSGSGDNGTIAKGDVFDITVHTDWGDQNVTVDTGENTVSALGQTTEVPDGGFTVENPQAEERRAKEQPKDPDPEQLPPTNEPTIPKVDDTKAPEPAPNTTPSPEVHTPPPAAGSTPPPATGSTPPPATGSTPPPAAGSTPPPAAGSTPPPAAESTPPPAAGSTPPPAAESTPPPTTGTKPGEEDTTGGVQPTTAPKTYLSKNDKYAVPSTGLTDRANEFGATDVSQPDGNNWHTHSTMKTGSYGPGETRSLADNASFGDIVNYNKEKNLNLFSDKDVTKFSKYDFVAQYAATGQYSVKDLLKTADALEAQGLTQFSAHAHEDYWPQAFQDILDKTEAGEYDKIAEQLQKDVESIEKEFTKVHDQMTEWAGQSKGAVQDAIECILGKFECTMGNIKSSLGPACKKIEEFKEKLKKLKAGKEELTGEDGNGGLDKELKDLELELEEKTRNYESIMASKPSPTITVQDAGTGGNDSQPTYRQETNPAYTQWEKDSANAKAAMDEAQQKVTEKEEEIKAKEEELNELLEDVLETYFLIKNLTQTVQSFGEYFNGGSKSHMIASKDAIYKYHDAIVDDFESFTSMPVITSLSGYYDDKGDFHDYKVGDFIMYDDAHGYGYMITQAFDPISGTIKIMCVDKDGKPIGDGKEIVVWDQREIVPMQWVYDYDPDLYGPYIGSTPVPTSIPGTTPSTPKTTPGPGPGPKTTPGPGPKTTPGPGPKTTPGPGPKTTPGPGPKTTPGPGPKTTPGPGPKTTPEPGPKTTPGPGPQTFGPFSGYTYQTGAPYYVPPSPPHTGLDAMTPNDTTASHSGLGALAALAAGAAGLGLTSMMSDDKEEEENKEEESKEEKTDLENQ